MLLVMAGFRAWFVLDYIPDGAPLVDFASAAILGLRFDLLVLAYLQIPITLWLVGASLLQSRGGPYRWLWSTRPYYFWSFFLSALIAGVDHGYYAYFQDHITVFAFGFIEDHTVGVLDMIWGMYPMVWISFGAIVFALLYFRFLNKALRIEGLSKTWPSRWTCFGISFLVFLITGIAARGSLGKFPLRARMASVSEHHFVNQSVLNGPFALKEALKVRAAESGRRRSIEDFGFSNPSDVFSELIGEPVAVTNLEDALAAISLRPRSGETIVPSLERPHVVIHVMESLGSYSLAFHSKDFPIAGAFGKYLPQGIFFERSLPTTNSTVGTISSMASGLPHLPGGAYLPQGSHSRKVIPTAPALAFQKAGYETNFLYGGNTTWRKLDQWLPKQGFFRVEGRQEIKSSLNLGVDDEAHFKVFDEHLFRYLYQKLKAAKKPQMYLVLTASNHGPYDIPSQATLPPLNPTLEYAARLLSPKVLSGRLIAFQYALNELGKWFDEMGKSGLLDNTLVVVTGDHNTMDITHFGPDELLNHYGVPIWFYANDDQLNNLRARSHIPAGHLNIFPTLMDCIGMEAPVLEPSLLSQKRLPFAMNGGAVGIDENGGFEFGPFGEQTWKWSSQDPLSLDPSEEVSRLPQRLNARLSATAFILNSIK